MDPGRVRRPAPLLHEPRRPGLRPGQPPGGREGCAVRPLQPQRQEPAAAVPRRVRGRPRHQRRPDRRRHRRAAPGRGALRQGVLRVRRRLGRPARRRAPGLRAGLEPAHEGARVGPPRQLPRAVHPLHRLRHPHRRPLPLPPAARGAREPVRHALHRRHGPALRHLRRADPAHGRLLPGGVPEGCRRLRLRLPPGHQGQGLRRPARRAAGGLAVEPRHLRLGPGLRSAAPADAVPPAPGGPPVRRAHAHRAAQGHPELPQARRPRRPWRRLEHLPRVHAHRHGGAQRSALPGHHGPRGRPGGPAVGVGPRRRDPHGRGDAVLLQPPPRRPRSSSGCG